MQQPCLFDEFIGIKMNKKMTYFKLGIGLAFLFFSLLIEAQITLPKTFENKLLARNLVIALPVENTFKQGKVRRNRVLSYDFAMRARREDLEIRYVLPVQRANASDDYPHILSFTTVTHVATNEEGSAQIASHRIAAKDLKDRFNADWGSVYFFKPKPGFSNKRHCKMLALYKEGKGMVYVFYLFDKAGEVLEQQQYGIWFEEE